MPLRLSESELIARYFAPHIGETCQSTQQGLQKGLQQGLQQGEQQGERQGEQQGNNKGLQKGFLDDTAFLPTLARDMRYAVSLDTMVEGVHILADSSASDWAHKLLAANLSDLAAQSASPEGLLLSLSLPVSRAQDFIAEFASAFAQGCKANDLRWLGGDLTSSPSGICASVSIFGSVSKDIDPMRANARAGDVLLVSGELGLSALGLSALGLSALQQSNVNSNDNSSDNIMRAISRYRKPVARWRESLRIGSQVRAMMDLSDGLLSDLDKLCAASGLSAEVWLDSLPIVANIDEGAICLGGKQDYKQDYEANSDRSSLSAGLRFALTGGEDFELLISAPAENVATIRERFSPVAITEIGIMTAWRGEGKRVSYLNSAGKDEDLIKTLKGYDHFRG